MSDDVKIRTAIHCGESWYFAVDTALSLGFAKPHEAVSNWCKDVQKTIAFLGGANQSVNIISSDDVYRLILNARDLYAVDNVFNAILPNPKNSVPVYDHNSFAMDNHVNIYRFWSYVDRSSGTIGCWPWMRHKNKTGYGTFGIGSLSSMTKTSALAHRIAYGISRGYMPSVVMHMCDNPSCCNPDHLSGGDQADNMADMIKKNRCRWAFGKGQANAKLTKEDVSDIKALIKDGSITQKQISEKYHISESVISGIKTGIKWKSVA